MIFRRLALAASLLLAACSQGGPTLSDGRVSPFSPGSQSVLGPPQAPGAAARALSPLLEGQAPSDPFARAVQCTAAMLRLKELMQQLAERVDARTIPALDYAADYYRDKARALAPPGNSSVDQAVAAALKNPAMAGPRAASRASACLRADTPPDFANAPSAS
jgi:hypothetical protein